MKILNLYACLGGNRYKWDEVAEDAGIEIEVTAVELDEELAKLYQERFPNDKVIVADAHDYLLENYMHFDFIWTSPPCPSHSRARAYNSKYKALYPDMKLYEEIILLETRFEGKYVVENVVPYYEPLIIGKKRGRHIYWTNFNLPNNLKHRKTPVFGNTTNELEKLCKFHEIDISTYSGKQSKVKIARNLVDYEAGKTIFETFLGIETKQNINQKTIFDI
jgi:DNA (cytosine-5)-methyltransferase 1